MFHRLLNLPDNRSCFLFGPRGTGKSTLLRQAFPGTATRTFNLLEPDTEDRLARDPRSLEREVLALPRTIRHVVVDEVQKLPRLLDVVHNLIETHKVPQAFVLTGSNARKLKAGGANLLAGRASLRHLFPLVRRELGEAFKLDRALAYGTLPEVWNLATDPERGDYLRAYAHGYLSEEIRAEQVVRRLDPFRRFLEVAAQGNGKVLNFTAIARDVRTDVKTVQAWYQVLEDTLMGFFVPGHHSSVRKQLRQAPKFYLFDPGIARAMGHMLNVQPRPGTSYFGDLFEHLVVAELYARNAYESLDWQFSYLLTRDDVEIDLVINRPGRAPALVEIKSTDQVREEHARPLLAFQHDFPEADLCLLSRDPRPQRMGRVRCLPWAEGILEI
jgi:predicted AAA+ superfamily ATPase